MIHEFAAVPKLALIFIGVSFIFGAWLGAIVGRVVGSRQASTDSFRLSPAEESDPLTRQAVRNSRSIHIACAVCFVILGGLGAWTGWSYARYTVFAQHSRFSDSLDEGE